MALPIKKKEKGTEHGIEVKSFYYPDETREFPKGKLEVVNIGGQLVARAILEPGWKWSTCVKPLAKTQSCEAPHFQYHVSGRLMVEMDDGSKRECGPGDLSCIAPGHDAWVMGVEPVIVVDFQGMAEYAKASIRAV